MVMLARYVLIMFVLGSRQVFSVYNFTQTGSIEERGRRVSGEKFLVLL